MQIVRLIVWILITAIVVFFISMNLGEKVPVRFWPLDNGDRLLFEWPVGIIALFFFLLGFIPMWLVHRGVKWRLGRRISSLESAQQARIATPPVDTPPPPPPAPAPQESANLQSEDTPRS